MDKLTEMHLLLREHGWEPESDVEYGDGYYIPYWRWKQPKGAVVIITVETLVEWTEVGRPQSSRRTGRLFEKYRTMDGLQRRLKALSKSVPYPADA